MEIARFVVRLGGFGLVGQAFLRAAGSRRRARGDEEWARIVSSIPRAMGAKCVEIEFAAGH